MTTLLDWRKTKSRMLSATPSSTAYCNGTSSVAAKVMTMTTPVTLPVFQTVIACCTRKPWKPATISSAPSAGMGTSSTSGAATSTMTATNSPAKMLVQRDFAPALMISAVPEIDPPAGTPLTRLVAMLATPWPRKSREMSGYLPSGLG